MTSIPTPAELRSLTAQNYVSPTEKIVRLLQQAAKAGRSQVELRNIPRDDDQITPAVIDQFITAGYRVEWCGPTKHTQDWVIRW